MAPSTPPSLLSRRVPLASPTAQLEMLHQHIRATNPMGRMGTVEEAAAVAAFLLSSETGFVTGSDYAVDGGEAQL